MQKEKCETVGGGHFAEIGISHLFVIRWEELASRQAGGEAGRQEQEAAYLDSTGPFIKHIHIVDFVSLSRERQTVV